MFDPTSVLANGKFGYITCHTGADYDRTPRHILWNPLRWQIGIGRSRPCGIVLNRDGALYHKYVNLRFRIKRAIQGPKP